ncbi:65-kDa microtubule-associated protein 3 [Glycine soja]
MDILVPMFSNRSSSQFSQQETTCHLLLKEIQIIWDKVGESDSQRDAMLREIEQKCLDLYRKEVDVAKLCRAQIQQEIADYVAEIAGFDPKACGSLKKARETVVSQLEEMRKLKTDRKKHFSEVLYQLKNISSELYGSMVANAYSDETNLSLKRLEELQKQLLQLQNEKASRLKQVSGQLNTLNSLCLVLGLDVKDTICEICPTMLEGIAASLLKMWDLMDTPLDEQQKFHHVTRKIAALESEFTESKILSIDSIIYVEKEVERIQVLKSTKVKEILLNKKLEKRHLTTQTVFQSQHSLELLDYDQIDHLITKTKEEALSRKEILEKVKKWLVACQEESWLEEYNRDDNRYNAGRGAHLTLKRAEKARALLSKIPGSKETSGTVMAEHETPLFGSKPSPASKSGYKASRCSTGIPRKDNSKASGHSVKTASSSENGIEIQSSFTRKPLSPVSPAVLSKANISNLGHDSLMPYIAGDEENMTPKNMALPVPTTPLTLVPMLTANTPDSVYSGATAASKTSQSFEYSFEEGLSKTYAQ